MACYLRNNAVQEARKKTEAELPYGKNLSPFWTQGMILGSLSIYSWSAIDIV